MVLKGVFRNLHTLFYTVEELEADYIPFHKAAALLKIPHSKLLIISKSKKYREILEVRICDNTISGYYQAEVNHDWPQFAKK